MTSVEIAIELKKLYKKAEDISYRLIEADSYEILDLEIELASVEEKIEQLEYEMGEQEDQELIEDWSMLNNE